MSWVDEFDYELPRDRIAQVPVEKRDSSRLLLIDPATGTIGHDLFENLGRYLSSGDLLVVNDSKVAPWRIRGCKRSGGSVEFLLLRPERSDLRWHAIARPFGRIALGTTVELSGGGIAVVRERGRKRVLLELELKGLSLREYLRHHGEMPVPPYIRRRAADPRLDIDRQRYQTVYAEVEGSVAAPTAGLHFTPGLLALLKAAGVVVAPITLDVGPATFMSLDDLEDSAPVLPPETYSIPAGTADLLTEAAGRARRVVAVGTTVTRALEDCSARGHGVRAGRYDATVFIRPGHRFQVVQGLITNFHQPRTGVFALACAFAGTTLLKKAYRKAIDEGYRFLSYGDSTFILQPAEGSR